LLIVYQQNTKSLIGRWDFLIVIAFICAPVSGWPGTEWCTNFAIFFGVLSIILLVIGNFISVKLLEPKQSIEPESEYNYSITTKIVDNKTGKHADIFISGNDPEKLGDGMSKFIQSSCMLVNMCKDDLNEVRLIIEEKIREHK
jgi:hypothetical protein